jgi:hypothetical protein
LRDTVQRSLCLGVAAHREYEFAAAVHVGHAQCRLARSG